MLKEMDKQKSWACPACDSRRYEPQAHYKFYGTSDQRHGLHLVFRLKCPSCECRFQEVYKVEFVQKNIEDGGPLDFIHDVGKDIPRHFMCYMCWDCRIVWNDYYREHDSRCPYCNSTNIGAVDER